MKSQWYHQEQEFPWGLNGTETRTPCEKNEASAAFVFSDYSTDENEVGNQMSWTLSFWKQV